MAGELHNIYIYICCSFLSFWRNIYFFVVKCNVCLMNNYMENQLMLHICEVYVFALINLPGRKLQAPKGGRQLTMPVLGVAKPRCRTKKYINKICEYFLKLQNAYTNFNGNS